MRRLLIDSLERTPSPIEISNQKCQSTTISHYKSSPLTGSGIMAEPSRKIQRDELYELVWAKCSRAIPLGFEKPSRIGQRLGRPSWSHRLLDFRN